MGNRRAEIVAGPFSLADGEMRAGSRMSSVRYIRNALRVRWPRQLAAIGGIGAMAVGVSVWPAAAYRPFDGTDAAVADVKEDEAEVQPAGGRGGGLRSR